MGQTLEEIHNMTNRPKTVLSIQDSRGMFIPQEPKIQVLMGVNKRKIRLYTHSPTLIIWATTKESKPTYNGDNERKTCVNIHTETTVKEKNVCWRQYTGIWETNESLLVW